MALRALERLTRHGVPLPERREQARNGITVKLLLRASGHLHLLEKAFYDLQYCGFVSNAEG